MFFNILSSLCIYNMIHFNNHRILFFQSHKLCYKWKLVLQLIKIYKTIDVLYKTTLYVNLFPKTAFPPLFWPGLKKCCYKYLQHLLLLDEHSYKLKKGILWTDHIKHETMSEAPSCAIFFFFLNTVLKMPIEPLSSNPFCSHLNSHFL